MSFVNSGPGLDTIFEESSLVYSTNFNPERTEYVL